jgi:acetyltransferase-like isoleucine patch superfamily enzyme
VSASRRLVRLTQALLRTIGKQYVIDPAVPNGLLTRELASRSVQLARGMARRRTIVFLGRGVRLRGGRRLRTGAGVSIGAHSRIDAYGERGVRLGARSRLGAYCLVTSTSHLARYGQGLVVGADSGIGDYAHLGCSGGIEIGDDVIAGPFLTIHSQEHLFDDPAVPIRRQGTLEEGVVLGDDIWIGARVTILAGSRIGSGSVIAAGSVVKGEFPPRSLIAGVPARRLRGIRGSD